nr:MAG: nonstructural polyprotein [Lake Sinai virus 2]
MKVVFLVSFAVFLICQAPPVSYWLEDLLDEYNTMCSYEYAAAEAYNNFVHKHRVAAYAAGVRVLRYRAPWYCFASRSVPVVHPFSWLMGQYDATIDRVGTLMQRLEIANVSISDGLRTVADTALKAYFYYQIIWFQLLSIIMLVGFFSAVICSSRVRVVRIRNRVRGYSVSELRSDFEESMSAILAPLSRGHSCLNFQRRVVESWAIDQLLRYFRCFRSVASSQGRWAEVGHRLHHCSPVVMDGAFVPEYDQRFSACRRHPSVCPDRFDIPAAILSHVDYYMTPDQLAATVTGPTFIVNHDYSSTDTLSVAEVSLRSAGGLITASVRDGPTFGPHPYYHWSDEGVVVASSGAFQYFRIGRLFDTTLYYAFPTSGTYARDDPSALRRSTSGDLHYYSPHEKRFVSYTADATHYHVFGVAVPRSLADYCAATFCRAVRDDKFYDSLRSYYQNRCRAIGFADARDTLMLDFIIHLCDDASLRTFGFSRLSSAPSSWSAYCLSWILVKVNHMMPLALTSYVLNVLHRFFGAKSAPWNWATIHLPTYDMVTSPFRLRLFGRNPTVFNLERFRAEATVVGSPDRGQSAEGACQDDHEHDIKSCDASVASCPSSTPLPGDSSTSGSVLLFDDTTDRVHEDDSSARSTPCRGSRLRANKSYPGRKPRRPADHNSGSDNQIDVPHPKRTTHPLCPDPTASCGPHFFMSVCESNESVPTLFHAHSVGGEDITHVVDPALGASISQRFSASQLRLLGWSIDGIFNTLSGAATSSFVESTLLCLSRFMREVPPTQPVTEARRSLLFCRPRERFRGYDTFDIGFMGIAVPSGKTKGVEACLREVARQHSRADLPNEGA